MLERNKGVDILAEVGGVKTADEAKAVIEKKLDAKNLEKLAPIQNEQARIKIANAIAICEPDEVFVDTGSAEDTQWIREYSLRKGEEKKPTIMVMPFMIPFMYFRTYSSASARGVLLARVLIFSPSLTM